MYDKRIKIFVTFAALVLLVWVLRLAQMQLLSGSAVQDEITAIQRQSGQAQQLKTVRGKILDRKGRILAVDEPRFQLHISYRLSSLWDERVQRAKLLAAAKKKENADTALLKIREEFQTKLDDLRQIIEKCTHFGLEHTDIETRIRNINDEIWNLRTFLAWARNDPDPNTLQKYQYKIGNIPLSEAIAAFEKKFPDETQRIALTSKVNDIAEMYSMRPLLELKTADDVFAAQIEFQDVNDVQILPKALRYYPYGSHAAQTIGWVGSATQERDRRLFANDRLASYLEGEVCGREDGVEYVCESILRGRRGELVYDIDHQLISQTETEFGADVTLTLDIELQKRIEQYLTNSRLNPNYKAPTAAVVIDVASGEILALVSVPVYDLNIARYDYGNLLSDPNSPLINRAVYGQYPPGSVVKPVILIAALESGAATAQEIIGCPAQPAPTGWPSCWIFKQNGRGHSDVWSNNARNAIKGSCNIYFSRLADRLEPISLQNWLFKFGYGRQIDLSFPLTDGTDLETRQFRQAPGRISSAPIQANAAISSFEQIPALTEGERRLFGIGHGNLRATPLQVANAFATIARGGLHRRPRLFLTPESSTTSPSDTASQAEIADAEVDLKIAPQTMQVVYDGMGAVVSERGGTAYEVFAPSGLSAQGVRVYGKTGSTEEPEHAWFAGFAQDGKGSKLALAVIVEGGQHGPSDAAPLARDIIQFCIESGYLGQTNAGTPTER